MKLTKFVHSCVLAEDGGKAVLFDPGIFSWNSGLVDIAKLPEVQTIVISHRHPDHFAEPFVQGLVKRFPSVQWIAPPDLHDDLKKLGAQHITDRSTDDAEIIVGDHAKVTPFGVQVQNLTTHWNGKVTDPGDNHEFTTTKDVLLLPIQAPWGTTVHALEIVLQMKPKYILPIHDWMWNEQWKATCYSRFEQLFKDSESTFLSPIDGQSIEIGLKL